LQHEFRDRIERRGCRHYVSLPTTVACRRYAAQVNQQVLRLFGFSSGSARRCLLAETGAPLT